MKFNKKFYTSCVLALLVLNFAYMYSYFTLNATIQNDYSKEFHPDSSANEITIITPENTTYSQPVSGFYPATYGFENDMDGGYPDEWQYQLPTPPLNSYIQVLSSLGGHNKVLDLNKGYTTGSPLQIWNDFMDQKYGEIEFWIRTTDISKRSEFIIQNSDNGSFCEIGLGNGPSFFVYALGGWQAIPISASNNIWYHISMQFECGLGNHYGLNQYYFRLIINGNSSLDYRMAYDAPVANRVTILQNGLYNNYHTYIDGIGFSWDPNYNIGDNLKEGLLLRYTSTVSLDWQGYSLDGTSNKTILGDTVIPFPSDGQHRLQLFGNDTIGTIYASNPRWFTIDTIHGIQIFTPENQTYIHPDSGYYLGTYGFESDKVGSNPNGWEITSGAGTGEVISEMMGHSKVLDLHDTSSSLDIWGVQTWDQAQSYGTVELWFYMSDFSKRVKFYCIDTVSDTAPVTLVWQGDLGVWKYALGSTFYTNTGLPDPISGWNHLSIHFERTTGNYQGLSQNHWKAVLNDHVGSQLQLRYNYNPNQFRVASHRVHYDYHIYVDALGYSWDPNYSIGDDLNEGLLLSYDTTTTLEWQGYSLDGAINRTILGNTVIPFLTDGLHQIQVFGNDSLGNSYKSQLRYFSIDSTLPYVSILSPLQYSYFSSNAPTFQVTLSGENLSTTFYQIGDSKILFDLNYGQINQVLWDNCAEGLVLITFYVNNTIGNYSAAEIKIFKDTILPFVSTYFSYEGSMYHSEAPFFNLNISDANLNLKWYTLNNDPFKHYFTGRYLEIDQGSWDYLDDGVVIITLHATDKAGNENSYQFYVIKDTSTAEPYNPPYFTPYLPIVIGGIVLLGAVVGILVLILNKKPQSRPKRVYYDHNPYHSQPVKTKQPEYSVPKKMLKCPYCSFEEDIDGNFCPQCGARLR